MIKTIKEREQYNAPSLKQKTITPIKCIAASFDGSTEGLGSFSGDIENIDSPSGNQQW